VLVEAEAADLPVEAEVPLEPTPVAMVEEDAAAEEDAAGGVDLEVDAGGAVGVPHRKTL
jgi:hypothetical protein